MSTADDTQKILRMTGQIIVKFGDSLTRPTIDGVLATLGLQHQHTLTFGGNLFQVAPGQLEQAPAACEALTKTEGCEWAELVLFDIITARS